MVNAEEFNNEELSVLLYALESHTDEEEFSYFTEEYQDTALDLRTKLTILYRERQLHYTMFEREDLYTP
jgi:hypothetical protein